MAARFDFFGGSVNVDMKQGLSSGSSNAFSNFTAPGNAISRRTLYPVTTGTSVVGVVFNGGVVIAADTLGSYGALARFRQCERLMKVNDTTILGAGGDYADYQFLREIIEEKVIEEECADDGFNLQPRSLHCWLTRVLYNRRSKFDPLWNTYIVGGIQDGQPFLGYVDKIGTAFETKYIASGFGMYIALPMLRDACEKNPNMNLAEAKQLLVKCLQVLYYRDARAFHKYQMAVVTSKGAAIEGPFTIDTNWEVGLGVCGYE